MLFIIAIFIIFLILTYVYINVYIKNLINAQDEYIETFNQEDKASLKLVSNRIKYLDYGMINYISREKFLNDIKKGNPDNGKPYIFIVPNNIDILCNTTTTVSSEDLTCSDANIVKSFEFDNLPFYSNERKPNFVAYIPINNDNNFITRIFDNEYKMKRRNILLTIISITPFINNRSGNKKWYNIKVSGNIKTFILSRPFFLTLNDFGLYKIIYDSVIDGNKESNSFIYYNSKDEIHSFYVEKIVDAALYPNTVDDINDIYDDNRQLVHRVTNTTPITIYYLMYHKNILFDHYDINSFYIHLNNIDLEKNNIIKSSMDIIINDSFSSDRVNTIKITRENKYTYKLFLIQSNITVTKELPVDFNPGNYVKYDIIISFSYDTITMVCIGKTKDNKEDCFVERYSNNNHNFIIEANKENLEKALSSIKPNNISITAIPFFPEIIIKRGYALT